MSELKWAKWPWHRCRAYSTFWEARCDLRHGHDGGHVADHGMEEPKWSDGRYSVEPLLEICGEYGPAYGDGVSVVCDREKGHPYLHLFEFDEMKPRGRANPAPTSIEVERG